MIYEGGDGQSSGVDVSGSKFSVSSEEQADLYFW